jgi:tRNA threonylcarbamoyladenosine biosynthesis protein TsaB
MIVLGIETATIVCSAALVRDGKVVHASTIREPHVHASRLVSQVDEVLRAAGIPLTAVDGIAVSIGPGSFTGLRVGLGVAKGLALAAGKPLVPVSTLGGLARRAMESGHWDGSDLLLVAIDARRGEVYRQTYGGSQDGEVLALSEEQAVSVKHVLDGFGRATVVVSGNSSQVRDAAGARSNVRFLPEEAASCDASAVACEGEERLVRGETVDPAILEPRYIKEFGETPDMVLER